MAAAGMVAVLNEVASFVRTARVPRFTANIGSTPGFHGTMS